GGGGAGGADGGGGGGGGGAGGPERGGGARLARRVLGRGPVRHQGLPAGRPRVPDAPSGPDRAGPGGRPGGCARRRGMIPGRTANEGAGPCAPRTTPSPPSRRWPGRRAA